MLASLNGASSVGTHDRDMGGIGDGEGIGDGIGTGEGAGVGEPSI